MKCFFLCLRIIKKKGELEDLSKTVSWDYYENWQWKKSFDIKEESPGQPIKEL